jgi:hypothetical protein
MQLKLLEACAKACRWRHGGEGMEVKGWRWRDAPEGKQVEACM